MPKICLVTKVWRSGTGWYAQLLADAIAGAGGEVAFVSPAALPASHEPNHPAVRRVLVPSEITDPVPLARRAFASLRRALVSTLKALSERRRGRVFVFTIPEPFLFTLPLFLALRLTGGRIVLVAHDPMPHALRFPERLRGVELAIQGLLYRVAHHVVVLAPAGREALERHFAVPAAKVSVIPHGPFPIAAIPPVPWSGRLVAFGTVRSNKNVLEVIRGVRLARLRGDDVRLLILGHAHPQEPEYWTRCLAEIAEDPDGFEVEPGFVPDEELPRHFAGVDAFVLAYDRFDSQSGVAIIAAICGRPVIGTAAGGLAELFAQGLAGEPIAGEVNAAAIAAAIAAFRAVPVETWRARAATGTARISDAIGWPRVGSLFVALARRLEAG